MKKETNISMLYSLGEIRQVFVDFLNQTSFFVEILGNSRYKVIIQENEFDFSVQKKAAPNVFGSFYQNGKLINKKKMCEFVFGLLAMDDQKKFQETFAHHQKDLIFSKMIVINLITRITRKIAQQLMEFVQASKIKFVLHENQIKNATMTFQSAGKKFNYQMSFGLQATGDPREVVLITNNKTQVGERAVRPLLWKVNELYAKQKDIHPFDCERWSQSFEFMVFLALVKEMIRNSKEFNFRKRLNQQLTV